MNAMGTEKESGTTGSEMKTKDASTIEAEPVENPENGSDQNPGNGRSENEGSGGIRDENPTARARV